MSTYSDAQDYLSKNGANMFVQKYGKDPAAYFQQNNQTFLNTQDPNNGYPDPNKATTTSPPDFNTGAPGSPTAAINSQNPTADPNKPYVQAGDTGGYLDGVGVTIGAGSSMTPAQRDSYLSTAKAAGVPDDWISDFLARNPNDYQRILNAWQQEQQGLGAGQGIDQQTGQPGTSGSNGGSGGGSPNIPYGGTGGSNGSSAGNQDFAAYQAQMAQTNALIQQMLESQAAQAAADKQRGDALYQQLSNRASQAETVSPTDPTIAAQTNAYRAEQDRSMRNYYNDLAEQSGPYANLEGERRIGAEQVGQNVGSMQATLMANELQSKRDEIASALSQMGGLLTADQQNNLQSQLGLLDNAIKQQQLGISNKGLDIQQQLGQGGLNNQLLSILLGNQLGNAQLSSNNDQFAAQLGLNAEQYSTYMDWLRTHGGSGGA